MKLYPAILPPSPGVAFFHSFCIYLQMKTSRNLTERETELKIFGKDMKNDMCYPVIFDILPGPYIILKFIRCTFEMNTDAKNRERWSYQKLTVLCYGVWSMSRRTVFY